MGLRLIVGSLSRIWFGFLVLLLVALQIHFVASFSFFSRLLELLTLSLLIFNPLLSYLSLPVLIAQLAGKYLAPFNGVLMDLGLEEAWASLEELLGEQVGCIVEPVTVKRQVQVEEVVELALELRVVGQLVDGRGVLLRVLRLLEVGLVRVEVLTGEPLLLEGVLRICRGPTIQFLRGSQVHSLGVLSLFVGVDNCCVSLVMTSSWGLLLLSWLTILNPRVCIHL